MITFYGENLNEISLLYALPTIISWYFYFKPIGQDGLVWVVFAFSVGFYYWVKRFIHNYCFKVISEKTILFTKSPIFNEATSEHLIDSFDVEILRTIDELRDEKDDYLKVLPAISNIMPVDDIFDRLAKLRSLGFIRVQMSRVTLTPIGFETINTQSFSSKAIVPPKFSTPLARARMNLDERNYNGVVDEVNILFENILKSKIEEELGDLLESKWDDLLKRKIINRPYEKASLGVLLTACKELEIITKGSIQDNVLGTFLKIRVPGKHSTEVKSDLENDAKSSLDLANIFVRSWFT